MTLFTLKYAIQIPFLLSAKRKTPFFWHTAIKLSSSSRALQCLLRRWNKARIKEGTYDPFVTSWLQGGKEGNTANSTGRGRTLGGGGGGGRNGFSRLAGWLVGWLPAFSFPPPPPPPPRGFQDIGGGGGRGRFLLRTWGLKLCGGKKVFFASFAFHFFCSGLSWYEYIFCRYKVHWARVVPLVIVSPGVKRRRLLRAETAFSI